MDWMPHAVREGIFTILFISGPLVLLAATLGLSVGIIQAATQIQEQTLGSAIKIIGLFLALIIFGFYMFQYMRNYTTENMERAFRLIPSMGSYILPRDNFLEHDKEPSENPIVPPSKPQEVEPATPGVKKLAEGLNEPGVSAINENVPVERLAPPPSQTKPNINEVNLRKQELTQSKPTPPPAPPVQPAAAPTPVQPQASVPTPPAPAPRPVQQQQAAPPPPQVTAPPAREEPAAAQVRKQRRRSMLDKLNRMRDSLGQPAL